MMELDIKKPVLVKGWDIVFENWFVFLSYLNEKKSNLRADTIEQEIKKGNIINVKILMESK